MLKNYFKIAFRNLLKHKNLSLINILGLAIGIGCFLLIGIYVYQELSYDKFNKNNDNIYFLYKLENSPSGFRKSAETQDPLPKVLRKDFPGLKNVVQFTGDQLSVNVNNRSLQEKVYAVTPSVFSMFTFPMLIGNPNKALSDVNSVVLTEETAKKYFGNENPLGKKISLLNKFDFVVSGVLSPIPVNSSISFDMLIPIQARTVMDPDFEHRWNSSGSFTFIQFDKNFSPGELRKQFSYLMNKYITGYLKNRFKWELMPLTDIHLTDDLDGMIVPSISSKNLFILSLIALAILLIAVINFTNISVARYSERIREIGVRKTLGAGRKEIIRQYLVESTLISFAAMLTGVVLVELCLPWFNTFTKSELSFRGLNTSFNLLCLLGFTMLIGLIAGYYPAFYISKFQPTIAIKSGQHSTKYNSFLYHFLIIAQFAIAGTLIIVLFIITRQISYMRNYDLGFDPQNLLAIDLHYWEQENANQNIGRLINEIRSHQASKGIISLGLSEHIPGYYFNNQFATRADENPLNEYKETIVTSIDENFINTYRMKISDGRNFSLFYNSDTYDAALLNKTAVRELNITNPIGKRVWFKHGENYVIVGVVDDIHFRSLQYKIEPVVYRYSSGYKGQYLTLRYDPEKQKELLSYLQNTWSKTIPSLPFEYFFVTEKYQNSYKDETKTAVIIGFFSALAIFLACLGLLGLTSLTVMQRTKEIGIRKVLGSSTSSIIALLSSQYLKLILLSNIVGWPVAYYFSGQWLQEFPYRIGLNPLYFILGSAAAVLLSLSVISSIVIKAATANPVKSLKYE
jgi:putative ABC transport system permease protein